MKPMHAIYASVLALGLILGVPTSGPAIAASKPVIFLSNAEPVSLDPMFTQSDADVILSIHDLTVRLVMTEPDPIITSHMVNPELSILPPKYYSENSPEKVAFAPVGAGGYQFVSYKPGEGIVLKAFEKYRLGKPPVEDVIV